MRELKFRAWDKKRNVWVHKEFNLFGEIVLMGELLTREGDDSRISLSELNDIAVMQFTGLKDKNGKEIYEGDICRHRTITDEGVFTDDWGITEIWFHKGCFLTRYFAFPVYSFCGRAEAEIEVIGNIYENQELLGESGILKTQGEKEV